MAPLHYVKRARQDIYEHGLVVRYKGTPGTKREGKMVTKIDRTKPANKKDEVLIHKGEPYYWWQFSGRERSISKNKPRRSQLTQSEFLSELWDIEDDISEACPDTVEDLKACVEEWKERIETLREQCEERRDNMPESLQESETGQLLQERYDGLDSWYNDIEAVDLDIDEEQLKQDAEADVVPATLEEPGVDLEEAFHDLLQEKIAEILDEIQNTNSGVG